MAQNCIVSVKFLKHVRDFDRNANYFPHFVLLAMSTPIINIISDNNNYYMYYIFIGFIRIYFFNLFSENLNLPTHSFLRRL
jgi:hypothetical protein